MDSSRLSRPSGLIGAIAESPVLGDEPSGVGRGAVGLPATLQILAPATMLLVGLAFAAWQTVHLHGYVAYPWSNYDEGVYISSAWQMNSGSAIFSSVFSSQPVVFLASLALALRIAGGSADAAHAYSLACGLLTLGGAAWLTWEIGGRWCALLAIAVLAVSPGFVIMSHAVEAEAPFMAFGTLAMAAATRFAHQGGRRWLALASLLVALATLSKLFGAILVAPLAVAMLLKWWNHDRSVLSRRIAGDAAMAAICLVVPVVLAFTLISPQAQWNQVIAFHLKAAASREDMGANLLMIQQVLEWDKGLVLLSAAGILLVALGRRPLALIAVSWAAVTFVALARYHPLFQHHIVVVLPPMAVLAGLVLTLAATDLAGLWQRLLVGMLLGCLAIVYLVWLPASLHQSRVAFSATALGSTLLQADWLKAHSGPTDIVVVDNQMVAVDAHRLVPPQLVDTSAVRCSTGYLPLSVLTTATLASHAKVVLLSRELRPAGRCHPYLVWLRVHYRQIRLPRRYDAIAFILGG